MSFGQLELDIQPPYVLDDLSEPLVLTADDVVAVSRKFQLFHQSCQSGETRPSADCVNSWAELAQHPTLFRILFKAVPQAFTTATIKSSETHEATVQRLLLQSLIPFDRQDTMIDFLRELNGDLASSAVGVWRQVPSSDAAPPVLDPAPSLFDVHHLALADRAFIRLSCLYLHNADCDSPCYEAFARFDAAYRKWRDRAFGKKSMATSDFFPTGIRASKQRRPPGSIPGCTH